MGIYYFVSVSDACIRSRVRLIKAPKLITMHEALRHVVNIMHLCDDVAIRSSRLQNAPSAMITVPKLPTLDGPLKIGAPLCTADLETLHRRTLLTRQFSVKCRSTLCFQCRLIELPTRLEPVSSGRERACQRTAQPGRRPPEEIFSRASARSFRNTETA
jgi:hypothetical protein